MSSRVSRPFFLLREGVFRGVFPGAVALLGTSEREFFWTVGYRALVPEKEFNREDTVYDLASLTKPLATVLVLMRAVSEGRISLSTPLKRVLPRFVEGSPWERTTILELTFHSSGLPAHRPLFRHLLALPLPSRKRAALASILGETPEYEPATAHLYSDLGFILLGFVLEELFGRSLRELFEETLNLLFEDRLELGYLLKVPFSRFAPTEWCGFRKKVIRGEVHDENTWALGGVSGAAGLFGTAEAIGRLLGLLLRAYLGEEEVSFLCRDLVREFWNYGDESWALGYMRGVFWGRKALGHLGFTGTSFWVFPEAGSFVVLLTNRVHPSRNNTLIRAFRKRFHEELVVCFRL